MMPNAIIVALAVLIGYPLFQIAAIRMRRPARLKFRALIDELLADPAYQGEAEHCALKNIEDDSYGSPLLLFAPVIFPIMAFAEIFDERGAHRLERLDRSDPKWLVIAFTELRCLPGSSPLWSDPRLGAAAALSIRLGFKTWPISMAIASATVLPFALTAICLRWARTRTLELVSLDNMKIRLAHVIGALSLR